MFAFVLHCCCCRPLQAWCHSCCFTLPLSWLNRPLMLCTSSSSHRQMAAGQCCCQLVHRQHRQQWTQVRGMPSTIRNNLLSWKCGCCLCISRAVTRVQEKVKPGVVALGNLTVADSAKTPAACPHAEGYTECTWSSQDLAMCYAPLLQLSQCSCWCGDFDINQYC